MNFNIQSKEILESIGVILGVILSTFIPILFSFFKKRIVVYFYNKRHPEIKEFDIKTMRDNVSIDFNIRQMMARMMGSVNADRINIFVWHNGTRDVHGVPFRKASCMYEIVKEGVSREQPNLKNLEIVDYPEFIELLMNSIDENDNEKLIDVCVNQLNDCSSKTIFLKTGVHCAIVKLLRLKGKRINYGFIVIGFSNKRCNPPISSECKLTNEEWISNITEISTIIESELSKRR